MKIWYTFLQVAFSFFVSIHSNYTYVENDSLKKSVQKQKKTKNKIRDKKQTYNFGNFFHIKN